MIETRIAVWFGKCQGFHFQKKLLAELEDGALEANSNFSSLKWPFLPQVHCNGLYNFCLNEFVYVELSRKILNNWMLIMKKTKKNLHGSSLVSNMFSNSIARKHLHSSKEWDFSFVLSVCLDESSQKFFINWGNENESGQSIPLRQFLGLQSDLQNRVW